MTARIASEIGKKARISNAVAVAALLHDIGKLVIAERAPEHLTRAMQGVRQDRRPLYMIEEELVGVSHAEVGAYLLSLWGLPSPVVEAVAHHHHPERVMQDKMDMVSVVYLANLLAHEHSGTKGNSTQPCACVDPTVLAIPDVNDHLEQWHEMAEGVAQEAQGASHV